MLKVIEKRNNGLFSVWDCKDVNEFIKLTSLHTSDTWYWQNTSNISDINELNETDDRKQDMIKIIEDWGSVVLYDEGNGELEYDNPLQSLTEFEVAKAFYHQNIKELTIIDLKNGDIL